MHFQFFQSSASYLNTQALTKYYQHYTRSYKGEGPHPSQHSKRFLSIDTGHFGLYYTLINRDAERHRNKQINIIKFDPLNLSVPLEVPKFDKFFILGLNQNFSHHISALKSKSKPSTLICSRNLSSSSLFANVSFDKDSATVVDQTEIDEDDYDLSKFRTTQIKKIEEFYGSNNLMLIYPVYQSLTRNNLSLPSIDLYNKVLGSIINRDLNNQLNLEDIEIKLTNLLTVYQDLLNIADGNLKPNNDTFNILINGLLDGCLNSILIYQTNNNPAFLHNESYVKGQEFSVITLELILSIRDFQQLPLDIIYPKLFKILNAYPNLVNEGLLKVIFNNLIMNSKDFNYYDQLIQLTNQFQRFDILKSNKACYEFILHIYDNYKQVATKDSKFSLKNDYNLYKSLIIELIKTNNLEISTQFLDTVLLDFKKNYNKDLKPTICKLLSSYLKELSNHDLNQAYTLLTQFNKVSLIPELSMDLYNDMIDKFVRSYYQLESMKTEGNLNQICQDQQQLYYKIWYLIDYNLIRKDFEMNSSVVNLSIDLNDSDSIFKLTKAILINNDLMDLTVFKKLIKYYHKGLEYNFNNYYEVLVNLVSQQGELYKSHGKLNDYFSEVINQLIVSNNQFSFNQLINSLLIKDVFQTFDLVNDKIYGLIQFSKYLIEYTDKNAMSISDLEKVMHYQSLLINEFENPEIVYVNLDEDLTAFKQSLIDSFKTHYSAIEQYSDSMIDTMNYLQLPIPGEMAMVPSPDLTLNLNLLMTVNYNQGMSKFINLFNQGNMFNYDTLFAIINKDFLLNHMKQIDFGKLVNNVVAVDSQNRDLMKLLIKENIDKVSIGILRNYEVQDMELMDLFLKNLQTSNNKYLFELVKNQVTAANLTEHFSSKQMMGYLKILQNHGEFKQVEEILNSTLAPEAYSNEGLLAIYLQNLLLMNQYEKFSEIIRTKFANPESVKKVLKNDNLISLINEYYVVNNYETSFFNKDKSFDRKSTLELCSEVFNQMLNPDNLTVLYHQNKKLVNLNQQIIMKYVLTKLNQLKLSFNKISTACSILNIKKLSVDNLKLLIQNLTIMKDANNLSIIFNKLVPSGPSAELGNYIKFNSWEILLNNHKPQEKLELLKMFESSFQQLNDGINLARLERVKATN